MKRILAFALFFLLGLSQLTTWTGCANIVPPQGGPRDSIPPVLLRATPADSSRNFTGTRITLAFDEFVDVQALQENLVVSPSLSANPTVEVRLNTVNVRIRDTLEPNTTYTLNFGNAIRDFNEGNVFRNFNYTFSTGPWLDSLQLKGNVILAETGKIDTTLVVILHTRADDSAVIRDRPRYVAKLDRQGNFVFTNLPPRDFYLYALKDEGGTRRYFSDRQLFAFADSAVRPVLNPEPVTLYAYASVATAATSGATTASPSPGRGNRGGLAGDKRLRYQTNLSNSQQDLLSPFIMTFEQPLRNFDSAAIRLYTDSLFKPVPGYRFELDSTRKKILLRQDWIPGTSYHIIMDSSFAVDSSGRKLLKADTLDFTTRKQSDYGSLRLRFRGIDMARHPVLQFVLNDNLVASYPLTTSEFTLPRVLPGEYQLRILYDRNRNGKWDPGVFFVQRLQPERVIPIERRISVKANWQNEMELSL